LKDLKKRTESGIKWSVIDQLFKVGISLIISIFLARLIDPSDFGLFAIVTVSVGFLSVFKNFGLGSAIIQKESPSVLEINSVFWLNLAIAIFISVIIFIGSYFASGFYEEPRLIAMIQFMALVFFISSFGLVPDGLIHKNLEFKNFFLKNAINLILSGSTAIWLAYSGYGIWALLFQVLISTTLEVFISYRMIEWRPSFDFSWESIKPFIRFSLPLLGENTINYWVRNIDNLLIGKVLGNASLGYYSRAYNLMLLPVSQISGSISRVMFPSFSIIKNDKEKVWDYYLKVISLTAFFVFPLMGILYLFADEIIVVLYGKNWLPTATILKGLCFLGAIQSIGTYSGSVFSSQGKTYLQFKIGLFLKPLMILGIVIGLYTNGISGVVYGYTFTSCTAFFVESFFLTIILNQKITLFFKGIYKEFLITICTLVFVLLIKKNIHWINPFCGFLLVSLIGGIIYFLLTSVFKVYGILFIKEKINGFKKSH
jgi:O-antigen/teichoic acid export membrane protein